jgi:methyl halide transferase
MTDILDAKYWDNRYQQEQTQWDIGSISSPLKSYIDQLTNKNQSILIPGCGNSYEAAYLVNNGFTNITLVDLSPSLTKKLRIRFEKELNHTIKIITGDFFELDGKWDLVLEQTFFCALDPVLRTNYVQKMHSLLNEGGRVAGVLFNREFEGGPPFGGSKEEYQVLFETLFTIRTMDPCYNSIKPREGSELFFIAVKK